MCGHESANIGGKRDHGDCERAHTYRPVVPNRQTETKLKVPLRQVEIPWFIEWIQFKSAGDEIHPI
jgi:hypothetical protein